MAVDYFAFQANPDYYRIEEAVINLDVDIWDVHRSNPKPGDRAIIWKSYGRNQMPRRRGIVGFAEILSTPSRRVSDNQYWIDTGGKEPTRRRVDVKYVRAPNLPLWEHDHPMLGELDISGTRRVISNLTSDQFESVIDLAGGWPDEDEIIADAEAIIADLSGRRLGNRQGYTSCSTRRRAVEKRAMELATTHYKNDGYDVINASTCQPYDPKCTKSEIEVHVEVKGTTSNGERILLTKNEVAHAREFPRSALFVVTNIARTHSDEKTRRAGSGKISEVLDPWNIDGGSLDPIAYTYSDFADNGL